MENEKIITIINNYQVIKSKKRGYVLLRSPEGANFSLPLDVCKGICNFFNLNDTENGTNSD